MMDCPYCGKEFHSLGIASHRAACGRKRKPMIKLLRELRLSTGYSMDDLERMANFMRAENWLGAFSIAAGGIQRRLVSDACALKTLEAIFEQSKKEKLK